VQYWLPKLHRNIQRDAEDQAKLEQLGWRVLIIWECETKNIDLVAAKVARFLKADAA
jgi:DNA mismatch endonuclease (patch repair protein)